MRAAARTMLVIICGAAAIAATSRPWLPPTPGYWPQVVGEQATRPQTITGGAQWHTETYQTVSGAQRAQVMNIDLTNPNIRFGAVEAGDKLIDPSDETISSMATRTGAVAGVNSDFFAINAAGQPDGMLIQNGTLEASPVASWPSDLEVLNNGQIEMATETYRGAVDDTTTGATSPLVALNRIDQTGLTAVTPYLGAVSVGASTIAAGTQRNGVLTIVSVQTSQTALPRLTAGQEDLIARRGTAGSTWLQQVHPGDALRVADALAPYGIGQIKTAVSGGAYLAQDGAMAVPVHGSGENNVSYPTVGIGVSKDGRHAIMAVFDGRERENQAVGLTRPQFAQWMLSRGAYNAIEFDSGGSAEMVARLPGQPHTCVLNHPSDGAERPVANGLFVYSTEARPAAAVRSVVNGGAPMAVLTGTTERLHAYATDAEGNPAATPVRLSVEPPGLATVTGSPTRSGTSAQLTLAAGSRPGSGWLVVAAGGAVAREPLTVTDRPRTLRIAPADSDLDNDATQQFSVTGTAASGTALTMTPQDASWTVSPARLGLISAGGLFTAAASGGGLATVTATAGGRSATTAVAVGRSATVVDPMTDTGAWALRVTNGSTATLSESTTQIARAGDAGSMDVHYSIPAANGVSQVVFSRTSGHPLTIGDVPGGRAPNAIGVWIKGIGGTQAAPLARGALTFAEAYAEVNGQADTLYPTAVTYHGWRLIEAQVPPGARSPLTLRFLGFLVIDPPVNLTGDIYLADLEALYPPRTGPPGTSVLARSLLSSARYRAVMRKPTVTALLALASVTGLLGGGVAAAATRAPQSAGSSSWTVYHGDAAGSGVAGPTAAVDTATRAWTSPALDGEIYGEPLVSSGRVYVATEDDVVYALSATTGAVVWSTQLGRPVPSNDLPCGNITPTVGITGTPVIDQSRGEIFVVADELVSGESAHMFIGLATASGKVEITQDVDPAADTAALLPRTGLTLDDGQVVFGMGGNYGDCAAYRGRLIAVPETGGPPKMFTVDAAAGESQGAIWMGGAAPVVDSRGDIWVSTGNGSVYSYSQAYDNSDSILELSPSLKLLQFFAPSTWATNNSEDLDMSTAPALLSDGQVLLAGKSRIVYLLNGAHLGGIGGQQAALDSACSQDIDGGVAVQGTTAYLPCSSGIIAVRAVKSPAALQLLWSSGTGGGPAIVAAGLVWTIGQNGILYGLSPATGKVRQQAPVGVPANHFPTPSVADGLLLAPAADQVVAFTASASAAGATAPPASTAAAKPTPAPSRLPTSHASSPPTAAASGSGGSLPDGAIAGLIVAGLVVIGGIGWLVWRRRTARSG